MMASRHRRRIGIYAAMALILIGLGGALYLRPAEKKHRVTVLAASSLSDAFTALAQDFEQRYPETEVELVFAGSQVLRMQVQAGAPGDVIASAHPNHLTALEGSGHAWPAEELIRNRLAVIVNKDAAPRSLEAVLELPRWILGSAQVPVGLYSQELFKLLARHVGPERIASLEKRVLSREPNVRMVRTKIEMGQADAAVVYASDVRPGVGVREVQLPKHLQVEVEYQIALLRDAKQVEAAKRFVAFARSKAGQAALVKSGFLPRREGV